jgi:thiaminase/transcriptional activator TenA
LGIPSEELEVETTSGATREYANFLLQAGATAEFPVIAASLLPCMWAFAENGQALAYLPGARDRRYGAWIRTYSDAEFVALSDCVETSSTTSPRLPTTRPDLAWRSHS